MAISYALTHGNGGMVQCLTLTHTHTHKKKSIWTSYSNGG